MTKVLFILKRREDYNSAIHNHQGLSTGLYNSASFMNNMLNDNGVQSKMVVVIDNNCIDREVTAYRPTHVIIEALWVTPSKFAVLQKLHPGVKWIIRLHSEMPFMAGEGMAMDWLGDYADFANVYIGVNAPRMLRETKLFLQTKNPRKLSQAYLYRKKVLTENVEIDFTHVRTPEKGRAKIQQGYLISKKYSKLFTKHRFCP